MKCEECLLVIEEFVEGDLGEQDAKRVALHVAACNSCRGVSESLRREQEIYARYRRDVEVTPALWAAVQARIEQQKPARPESLLERMRSALGGLLATPRLSPAFAAALVIMTICTTVAVVRLMDSHNAGGGTEVAVNNDNGGNGNKGATQPGTAQPGTAASEQKDNEPKDTAPALADNGPKTGGSAPRTVEKAASRVAAEKRAPRSSEPNPDQLVRDAEQKYLAAIDILSRDVNRSRSRLDPAVLARFTVALNDIDRTIAETRRAARENPDDPIALQYMLSAYRQKVQVLREMARN